MNVVSAGNLRLQHEARDVFVYYFGPGPTTPEHLREIIKPEYAAWADGVRHIYSITALDPANIQAPGFFVEAVKLWRGSPPRTSAFVLRHFKLRNAMEFFLRSIRFVGVRVEIGFFEEEEAARMWLLKCKEARLGRASRP